jgi:hypothetical protein
LTGGYALVSAQEFEYVSKEDIDVLDGQIQGLRKRLYALINRLPVR